MKQKLVIKLSLNNHTSRVCCFGSQNPRSKAMKIVAGFPGIQSVEWDKDQDQIKVTGVVDAINLTSLLRKKVGFAELVSVSEDKIADKTKDNPGKPKDPPGPPPIICSCPRVERIYFLEDPYPGRWCWPLWD
ncbi:hypothetical protein ACJRO7_007182 [Eucalyptus globulus]|uniref:HMA domain-containing protein n=1 Tax=Eucalyptus globulus TaxID=34317 RepID=A0ABD3IND0_EUCGL